MLESLSSFTGATLRGSSFLRKGGGASGPHRLIGINRAIRWPSGGILFDHFTYDVSGQVVDHFFVSFHFVFSNR